MYDWEKEIDTSSPEYYKWTQWLFGVLYRAGLAYQAEAPVNWCPSCKTVLANEQVINGCCERCETEVVQKNLKQWFFKITKYADRLLKDHKKINWPEKTITMQKNWIGRSEGINFKHKVKDLNIEFEVYDSIPQTFRAQTFFAVAPEHSMIEKLVKGTKHEKVVMEFVEKIKKKKMTERFDIEKNIEGIFTGRYVENYLGTGRDLPIWITSFVLVDYGTGIVGCSAHDERDFVFAKKYNLPLKPVLFPKDKKLAEKVRNLEVFYREPDGILEEPKEFKGKRWDEVREPMIKYIERNKLGKRAINYKLRDWLISRQRYWGAPIPIIYCDKCGEVLVPEKDLPVKLPDLKDFKPTKEGEPPLARSKEFVNVKCPKCKGDAKRSTETMDTFVCSSWYFLRYLNPHLKDKAFDKKLADKWLPVDQYCGGAEHTCMHLLYARFITKVLYDKKFINFDEPFPKLNHQGMILASDGIKMSKSKGNVVIPDDYIKGYGADTFRLYVLFIAPFEEGGAWNDKGIVGANKFLKKVWFAQEKISKETNKELKQKLHYTIKKVSDDLENFKFNTAVASMMEFVNAWMEKSLSKEDADKFLRILAPFAPHICEELWSGKGSIFQEKWSEYDEKLIKKQTFELVIQINGKVRDRVEVETNISQKDAEKVALEREKIKKWLSNKKPKVVIFIKGRLINIVI